MVNKYSTAVFIVGIAALAAGLVLVFAGFHGRAYKEQDVVATVNGENITKEEFYGAMLEAGGPSVLQQLITEKVLIQEAKKAGVNVDDEKVRAQLTKMKDQLGGEGQFQTFLTQYGITEKSLERQVRVELLIQELISRDLKLTEADLREYFEQNKDKFNQPEAVKVRRILSSSRSDAEAILNQLNYGATFESLARERSKDVLSARNGGDLGYITRGQMDPKFEEVAFSLKPGDVSEIFETPQGFEIIKVEARRPAKLATFEESKDKVREALLEEKVQELAPQRIAELLSKAKIENRIKF